MNASMISKGLKQLSRTFSSEVLIYYYDQDRNFGDLLNLDILRHYGYRPLFAHAEEAELFAIGSLLEHCPTDFDGFILGTGYMHEDSSGNRLSHAGTLALRGWLSAKKEPAAEGVYVADPGLLASQIFGTCEKKWQLGIVPHFTDKSNQAVQNLAAASSDICVIDVQQPVTDVVHTIAACNHIVSSSLHGLIVADSYGIPAGWLRLSDTVKGNGFKFRDYNSSLGIDRQPLELSGDTTVKSLISQTLAAPPDTVNDLQRKLEHSYGLLRKQLVAMRLSRVMRKSMAKLRPKRSTT